MVSYRCFSGKAASMILNGSTSTSRCGRTLDVATQHGCGLEAIFRRYDTSGEGVLDVSEFSNAVEDMGFDTGFAADLFMSYACRAERTPAPPTSRPSPRSTPQSLTLTLRSRAGLTTTGRAPSRATNSSRR